MRSEELLTVMVLSLSGSVVINGQVDCPLLLPIDLGNTTAPSSVGMLADTFAAVSGMLPPSIQILEINPVCLSAGTLRGTYTTTSLVVRYLRAADNMQLHVQVEYDCSNGQWGPGLHDNITMNPVATLMDATRRDCIRCAHPGIVSSISLDDNHCIECDPCHGLRKCTGSLFFQVCCNYYNMADMCVVNCPVFSSPNATFDCECNPGYTLIGGGCMEIDECDTDPCQNGGNCTDMINGFSCACATGFTNTTCSVNINECESEPCENGGNCTDLVNSFSCDCVPGFTGETCFININECGSDACENGGNCTDLINDFSCACAPGFTNKTCSININECDPDPCKNGGNCTDLINDFSCACVPGFTNKSCSININECNPDPCENGGNCTDLINDFSCACVPGFTNKTCSININECDPDPCENGGNCTDLINDFSCTCIPGFTNKTCSININECDPDPCENGGSCTDLINGFSCACVPGFTNKSCSININECDPDPCENGGNCTDLINGFSCACVPGFTNKSCSININECDPDPCENGGNCTDLIDDFSCSCVPEFTNKTCSINIDKCNPDPCENGGNCTDLINDFYCSCSPGFTNETCSTSINVCDPDPCENGGDCIDLIGFFSCICAAGFTEETCSTNTNDCDPDPCQNGGTCVDLVDDFSCACAPDFTGDTCMNITRCSPCPACEVCISCFTLIVLPSVAAMIFTALMLTIAFALILFAVRKHHSTKLTLRTVVEARESEESVPVSTRVGSKISSRPTIFLSHKGSPADIQAMNQQGPDKEIFAERVSRLGLMPVSPPTDIATREDSLLAKWDEPETSTDIMEISSTDDVIMPVSGKAKEERKTAGIDLKLSSPEARTNEQTNVTTEDSQLAEFVSAKSNDRKSSIEIERMDVHSGYKMSSSTSDPFMLESGKAKKERKRKKTTSDVSLSETRSEKQSQISSLDEADISAGGNEHPKVHQYRTFLSPLSPSLVGLTPVTPQTTTTSEDQLLSGFNDSKSATEIGVHNQVERREHRVFTSTSDPLIPKTAKVKEKRKRKSKKKDTTKLSSSVARSEKQSPISSLDEADISAGGDEHSKVYQYRTFMSPLSPSLVGQTEDQLLPCVSQEL